MNSRLQKSFKNIFYNKDCINSFYSYYNALRNWVLNNSKFFKDELDEFKRLKMLLYLNIEDYDINEIGRKRMNLSHVKKSLSERNYKKIGDLLKIIENNLWDMVTIEADLECDCIDGDPRYIIIPTNKKSKVFVECNYCKQIYNINGEKTNIELNEYLPAKYNDIINDA